MSSANRIYIHSDIYSRATTTRSKNSNRYIVAILEKPPKASVTRKNFDCQFRFAFPLYIYIYIPSNGVYIPRTRGWKNSGLENRWNSEPLLKRQRYTREQKSSKRWKKIRGRIPSTLNRETIEEFEASTWFFLLSFLPDSRYYLGNWADIDSDGVVSCTRLVVLRADIATVSKER